MSKSQNKTTPTKASVTGFINAVIDPQQKADCKVLVKVMQEATGEKPVMWGTSIIGYGQYHYKSERSVQEGEWMLAGLSPRSANLTVYIMSGAKNYPELLKKLGKHKASGGSCVYINKLSDVDLPTLKKLVKTSASDMKKRFKEASRL